MKLVWRTRVIGSRVDITDVNVRQTLNTDYKVALRTIYFVRTIWLDAPCTFYAS